MGVSDCMGAAGFKTKSANFDLTKTVTENLGKTITVETIIPAKEDDKKHQDTGSSVEQTYFRKSIWLSKNESKFFLKTLSK